MTPPATLEEKGLQRAAIEALLERSGRSFVPMRRSLLQTRDGQQRVGGPLAHFGKRAAALDLYLLAHAVASREPWDVVLPARVWARLIGAGEDASGRTRISRQWSWLEEQRLVRTERKGRDRRVILLREDGSGAPYTHPGGDAAGLAEGDYFQLPHAYWRSGWDARLSMSSKMVLLIALSLQDGFILPVLHGAGWYSLSATRIHEGLRDLRSVGLLDMTVTARRAPLTESGVTYERHYSVSAELRNAPARSEDKTAGLSAGQRRLLTLMQNASSDANQDWLIEQGGRILRLADRASIGTGTRQDIRGLLQRGLVRMDRSLAPQWVFRLRRDPEGDGGGYVEL